MEENDLDSENSEKSSGVEIKMRSRIKTQKHRQTPYARPSSYHSSSAAKSSLTKNQENNDNQKGLIGLVTGKILPTWISNWWNPSTTNTTEKPLDNIEKDEIPTKTSSEEKHPVNGKLSQIDLAVPNVKKISTKCRIDQNDNMAQTSGDDQKDTIYNNKDCAKSEIKQSNINEKSRKRKILDDKKREESESPSDRPRTFYDQYRSHKQTTSTKPAFNVSAFMSNQVQQPSYTFNTSLNSSSFDFTSSGHSPFYRGSTMFGGSSSIRESESKRVKLSPVSTRVKTTRTNIKAKPLSSNRKTMVTSNTAKRILSTLGRMSTPVKDANSLLKSSNTPSFSELLKANSKKKEPDVNKPPVKTMTFTTQAKLSATPSKLDSIKRFNKKADESKSSTSSTVQVGNPNTTSSVTSFNKLIEKSSPTTIPTKSSMKMRREKTSMHYSSNINTTEVVNTMPEVTRMIPLAVTSLPKFNFSAIKPINTVKQASIATGSPSLTPILKPKTQENNTGNNNVRPNFMFSSPCVINTKSSSCHENKDFQFSSPVNLTAKDEKVQNFQSTPMVRPLSNTQKFKPSEGSWECPTCMITNNKDSIKCAACSESKPENSQTISNKLEVYESKAVFKKLSLPKPSTNTWSCPVCMIDNGEDVLKCVACAEAKPVPALSITTEGNKSDSSNVKQFKLKLNQHEEGSWSCPVCMIDNKKGVNNCAACGFVNSKADKSLPVSSQQKIDSSKIETLKKKLGQDSSNTWECPTCMISNKLDVKACVACKELKPGETNSIESSGFTKTSFKFEEKSKSGPSLPTSNKTETSSFFKFSSTNSEVSSFKFSASEKTESSDFTFGAQSKTNTQSGFTFGTGNKTDGSAGFTFGTPEKKEISAGFKFGFNDKPNDFKFGSSTTEKSADKKIDNVFANTEKSSSEFKLASDTKAVVPNFNFLVGDNSKATSSLSNEADNNIAIKFAAPSNNSGFTFNKPDVQFDKPNVNSNDTNKGFQFGSVKMSPEKSIFQGVENTKTEAKPAFSSIADAAKAGFLNVTEVKSSSVNTSTNLFGSIQPSNGFSFGQKNNDSQPTAPVMFSFAPTEPTFNLGRTSNTTVTTASTTFGNSVTPIFNFGSAASAIKPPASFSFGDSSIPSFENKPIINATTEPNVPVSIGFSFPSNAAQPSFNFGSTSNKPFFTQPSATTSSNQGNNLLNVDQSSQPTHNPFNVVRNVSSGGIGSNKRRFIKAARRVKK